MITLGLTFGTPLLLLGLLAALIPLVLHLLARAHAQELFFPTLRFLRLSMEKTARRRRIQHLLLMLLRMLLLLLLALSVAEPISEAIGGWTSHRYAAVIILDNSLSMGAAATAGIRLDRARMEAEALLGGDDRPTMAALLTTNGGFVSRDLTGQMDNLREQIKKTRLGYGRAGIAQRVAGALEMLDQQSIPQKSIYLFSDLQRVSFQDLMRLKDLAEAEDVHLLVINVGGPAVKNVGIGNLEIAGQRIVDRVQEFTATRVNSSPTDKVVDVSLRVDGATVRRKIGQSLSAAGREGSSATVRFYYRFSKAGTATGEVVIEQADDLIHDNVRRFSVDVGGRVRALVVRGPLGDAESPFTSPDMMLFLALSPYEDESDPWSISAEAVEADRFSSASLNGVDAVFFCDVPSFTPEQADGIREFAAAGGTVTFFVGPEVNPANYNQRFVQEIKAEGGLMPGRLQRPVGQVGPTAGAVPIDWVDRKHPYFEGLYEGLADYLSIIVQRYYRLKASARPGRTLIRLENGDPLLLVKSFGSGRVVFCTTTASRRWSNLPLTGLFLPMVVRTSWLARRQLARDDNFQTGAQVAIRPQLPPGIGAASVDVLLPPNDDGQSDVVSLPVKKTSEGLLATFGDTRRPGIYRWKVTGGDKEADDGAFAVNPNGVESRLEAYSAEAFKRAMVGSGVARVYVGPDVASVTSAASAAAVGRNWWDLLLILVILLLVVEAVVANRFRKGASSIPAHLNPRIAA